MQQVEQALGRPGGAHHVAPDFRHGSDSAGHQGGVKDEGGEFATGQRAGMDLTRAYPEDEDDRSHHCGNDQCGERRAYPGALDPGDKAQFRALGESVGLLFLLCVGLHGRHRVKDFTRQRRCIGDPVLRFTREFLDLAPDGNDRKYEKSHQSKVQGEQVEAGDRQHDHAANELENAAQTHRDRTADHGLDQCRVAGQSGQHFSGLQGLEELRGLRQHPCIDGVAQIGCDPLPDPRHGVITRCHRQRPDGRQPEKRDEMPIQAQGAQQASASPPLFAKAEVDQVAKGKWHQQDRRRSQAQKDEGERNARAVGPQKGP